MQLDAIQAIGLLALVTIIPLLQGIKNWRENRWRRHMADAHGWRHSNRGWKSLLGPDYTVAGTTPAGIVWEVRRIQQQRHWFLLWSSRHRLLPYGKMCIRPRQGDKWADWAKREKIHRVTVGSPRWQNQYVLWATHDMLGQRYFNQEAELAMMRWPHWPSPGALEDITWNPDWVVIRVRHHKDWSVLNRIVVLGTALVDNAVLLR